MLRLEKAAKTSDINVIVHQREPFFNRILCSALAAALSIHLIGLLFFHIAPFRISYPDSLFPPVAVASDVGPGGDGLARADIEEDITVPPYLLLPERGETAAVDPASLPLKKRLDFYRPSPEEDRLFLSAEYEVFAHANPSLEPPLPPPLKINFSGALSAYPMVATLPAGLPAFSQSSSPNEAVLVFDVQVEGKTGRIMWLQLRGSAPPSWVQWGEGLLREARFAGTSREAVISGKVEIFVRGQA